MMDKYFQRSHILAGEKAMMEIKKSSIAVIGLGGVGSFAAEALARCGIGHMAIIDFDWVDDSNINRQLLALHSTIGHIKTDVMAARLLDINPSIKLDQYTIRYTPETSAIIIGEHEYSYVVDAIDSLPDKIHLIKTCLNKGLPIISSMGMANRFNPLMLDIADIEHTSVCPMARRVRKELRKEGILRGLEVVYSKENPVQISAGQQNLLGSMVYVTATAGLLMAGQVINRIIG